MRVRILSLHVLEFPRRIQIALLRRWQIRLVAVSGFKARRKPEKFWRLHCPGIRRHICSLWLSGSVGNHGTGVHTFHKWIRLACVHALLFRRQIRDCWYSPRHSPLKLAAEFQARLLAFPIFPNEAWDKRAFYTLLRVGQNTRLGSILKRARSRRSE